MAYQTNWHPEGVFKVSINTRHMTDPLNPWVSIKISDDKMENIIYFNTQEELQDFINKIVDANIDASFGKEE